MTPIDQDQALTEAIDALRQNGRHDLADAVYAQQFETRLLRRTLGQISENVTEWTGTDPRSMSNYLRILSELIKLGVTP